MTHWLRTFETALSYNDYLDRHANPDQRLRWQAAHARVQLAPEQRELLGGFVRRMPVLCLAGAWCGDCVRQCPILDHFAQATPGVIDLRFLDRDADPEVANALKINGGHRVPTVLWLSEDFEEVARFGDRTLAGYRQMAAEKIGPACPIGVVPPTDDLLDQIVREWLDQFERVHLLLRLSPRLRERHGD